METSAAIERGTSKKFSFLRRHPRLIFFGFLAILHAASIYFVATKHLDISPIQDALQYRLIGQNVLAGHGFSLSPNAPYLPQVLRPPSYPLFLAALEFFDKSGLLIIAVQQILLLLSGWMLFKLFDQYGRPKIGYCFTGLFLIEPLQWMLSLQTMSESFYGFFMFLSLYLLLRRPNTESAKWFWLRSAVAGVALGIATLARPVGLLWTPGLGLLLISNQQVPLAKKLKGCLLFATCFMLLISSWLIRNYALLGTPTLSSSYQYNVISIFGTPAEKKSLEEGPQIFDAKGRVGSAMVGFNANEYPNIKKKAAEVTAHIGQKNIVVSQLLCAPKIWFDSRYDTILDMIRKGTKQSFLGRFATYLDNMVWATMLLLVVGGLVALYKEKKYYVALALGSIILANAVITLCVSYSRMRVPLLGIIFFLGGLGASYLYGFCLRFSRGRRSAMK